MTRTLRIVLVGCGSIAGTWLKAVAEVPGLALAGFVDLDAVAAGRRRDEFAPGAVAATDLEEVLETARPDVVFNCTVPEAHHAVGVAAFHAGCHVLSEKPLANSMTEGWQLCDAARGAGRLLAVTQTRRYGRAVRHARRLIAEGGIGRVTEVTADFYVGAHFGGFRERMPHVLLLDMAIHHFDIARFLSGAEPLAVVCREWNPAGSWYERDACAHAFFEMTDGVAFGYRGSWCAEGCRTEWNGAWRVAGTQGSLTWDGRDDAGIVVETVARKGGFLSDLERVEEEVPGYPDWEHGHGSLIREFARCVRVGEVPETAAEDNLRTLAMVFGAIRSAEEGRRVLISEGEQ